MQTNEQTNKVSPTCTPEMALTTVDFPWATWPMVPRNSNTGSACGTKTQILFFIHPIKSEALQLVQSNVVCFPLWLFVGSSFPWTPSTVCCSCSGSGCRVVGCNRLVTYLPNYTRPIPVLAKSRWGCSVVCRISGVGLRVMMGVKQGDRKPSMQVGRVSCFAAGN